MPDVNVWLLAISGHYRGTTPNTSAHHTTATWPVLLHALNWNGCSTGTTRQRRYGLDWGPTAKASVFRFGIL